MVNWGKLIFGGVDSSEYGIYITGEAVYNAPERDVEFIEVPGRNGSVAMDKGRYKNITVTYPAGTFGKNQEDFREALSAFRNAILSQKGYQRLEDTYHPEEYRMGVYAAGLEVSPASRGKAGQFDLSFVCKPQRFLSIGDYPIPVEWGDVLENPTQFSSKPLLEVEGDGYIEFGESSVVLYDVPIGNIKLDGNYDSGMTHSTDWSCATYQTDVLDDTKFNDGDTIHVGESRYYCYVVTAKPYTLFDPSSGSGTITPTSRSCSLDGNNPRIVINLPATTFSAGTASEKSYGMWATLAQIGIDGALIIYVTAKIGHRIGMNGTHYIDQSIIIGAYTDYGSTPATSAEFRRIDYYMTRGSITVDSSMPALGHPTYIDCETGDAYKYNGNKIESANSGVFLGNDLPTLRPGQNKFIFSPSITDLKITPRWWKI